MSKVVALVRSRENGDPAVGETVTFRNAGGTSLGTDDTGADGSASYQANGNPAGIITWDTSVSGDTRKASGRAQRQIGAMFEAELPAAFGTIMGNGYGESLGDECAVIPGSGRQVIVGTGGLWVQGIFFKFYTTTPLTAAANATGSTRLDRVVLRCDLDESSDTYGMGVLTYLVGTTSLPAINSDTAGDYDYLLANISAANGFAAFTTGNITDFRSAAGPLALASGVTITSPTIVNPSISVPLLGATISSTELSYLDGASANIQTQITTANTNIALKANAANPVFTGTPTFPDGSIPQADVTGLVAALALLAPLASPTITGILTAARIYTSGQADIDGTLYAGGKTTLGGELEIDGALNHDGSTVGFYGATPVAKQGDPADITSGTIDTTWGTTEAAVLSDLRDNVNDLKTILRNLGLISA